MVGQDADGEDPQAGEALLRAGEPLEDGVIQLAVGPEEEASLMAACSDQVHEAWFVASQRASHRRWQRARIVPGSRGTSWLERGIACHSVHAAM